MNDPSMEGASHLTEVIDALSVGERGGANSEPREYELLHESETTRIFRSDDGQGIKVLTDPNLSLDERLELFQFEQRVSYSLPPSCSQRKVLHIENGEGVPGMYFEWVDGVTVDEWLRPEVDTQLSEQTDSTNMDLIARLKVAVAITKTVCDFHEAGLFHGHLSLENVILNFSGEAESCCTATLIDFAKSAILSDCSLELRDEFVSTKTQKDLNDLGLIIYSVLSNHIPDIEGQAEEDSSSEEAEDENSEVQARKRGRRQETEHTNHLPLYLVSLVSSLLAPTMHQRGTSKYIYTNARNVLSDLMLAAKNPETYLKVLDWANLVTRPLVLPQESFYGRRTELSMVQHSFDSMMTGGSKPCVLVVSGYAGVGKSSLLRQINKPLEKSNGYMIVCKFNQTDSPDTILTSGFDSFFEHVIDSCCTDIKASLKMSIVELLGDHARGLEESMPHLRVLLGHQGALDIAGGESGAVKLRWKFLLSNLVRAISSHSHPIALLFEDLHWADDDTFDTIQLIVSNSKIRHCLFCMSYRGIDAHPKLSEMTGQLQDQGALLWNIKLGSIEKEAVDNLVSETLCMPPTMIEPLSSVVRNKTGGVILFVVNLLKSLHEENMIHFNLAALRWEFDLDKIMEKEISNDIINFLSQRIMRLPQKIQTGLKVAACLGSSFDLAVFQKANNMQGDATDEFVSLVTENGFLQELSPNQLTWSHDELQEAAYSLIPTNKREQAHMLIGTRIYLNTKRGEVHTMIHEIVRNMNIGMSQLDSQERKTELAQLNFVAGEQSQKSSAFYSAANYFMTGVGLLDDNWQNNSYELGMKLFNAATNMLIVIGHLGKFDSTIEPPLTHARNLEDRLPAYHTSIRFLCLSGRFAEALATCFSLFNDFGEDIPVEVTSEDIHSEILKTQSMLACFPKDDLKTLPELTDPMKLWMMKTMSCAMLILYSTKLQLAMFIGCRMTQRSIEFGWCSDSAFGLFSFGHAVMSETNNVDDGCLWAKLAIALMEQFQDRGRQPVLKALCTQNIFFWKQPIQATSSLLITIHSDALLEGQMEFAMSSAMHSCRHSFMSGKSLAELNDNCISVANKMAQLQQVWSAMFHVSLHILVMKLVGNTDVSPAFIALTGHFNNEQELLQLCLTTGKQTLVQYIHLYRSISAFWLQDYDVAIQNAALYGKCHMRFMDIYHIFYEGMTALRLALTTDVSDSDNDSVSDEKEHWVALGADAVSTFQTWEGHSNWNFENKYLLLLAELNQAKGDNRAAEEHYKASIASAQKHKFIHEEGLAMELLGLFYKKTGRTEESIEMLMSARFCYEQWGAAAVIERLDSQMSLWHNNI